MAAVLNPLNSMETRTDVLTRAGNLQIEQGEQLLFKYRDPAQTRGDTMRVSFGEWQLVAWNDPKMIDN